MSQFRLLALVVPLSLSLFACKAGKDVPSAEPAAQPAAGGGANPIEAYKQKRLQEAMAGLRYEGGRIEIDEEAAAELAGLPVTSGQKVEEGYATLEAGDRVDAIRAFTQAVLLDRENPDAFDGLGTGLLRKGLTEEALLAFRAALDLDAERLETRFHLGEALQMSSHPDDAISVWRDIIAADAQHAEAHTRLAVALYYQHDYEASLTHLEVAEALAHDQIPSRLRPMLEAAMNEGG